MSAQCFLISAGRLPTKVHDKRKFYSGAGFIVWKRSTTKTSRCLSVVLNANHEQIYIV